MNLARSAADVDAARFTASLGWFALRLADEHGIEVRAAVDRSRHRLVRIYQRRGFKLVGGDERQLFLCRDAVASLGDGRDWAAWRNVLHTGRTRQEWWQRRFGPIAGPLLDVGAGDSPLAAQLRELHILAVALDPQYALRPPARPGAASIVGIAEALPFRERVFATVYAGYVVQHTRHVQLALAECLRVARADGLVVVHPAWGSHRRHAELARLPGVRIVSGRLLPPGRQRPTLVISMAEFSAAASAATVAMALRPSAPARALGRLAMRLAISVWKTSSVGPGAAR